MKKLSKEQKEVFKSYSMKGVGGVFVSLGLLFAMILLGLCVAGGTTGVPGLIHRISIQPLETITKLVGVYAVLFVVYSTGLYTLHYLKPLRKGLLESAPGSLEIAAKNSIATFKDLVKFMIKISLSAIIVWSFIITGFVAPPLELLKVYLVGSFIAVCAILLTVDLITSRGKEA